MTSCSRALGLDRQRMVAVINMDHYITAPCPIISEPLVPDGAPVTRGTPVTRIHGAGGCGGPPIEICADQDGYVGYR